MLVPVIYCAQGWISIVYGMADTLLDTARLNRKAFSVMTFEEAERADLEYWRACTPDQRLEALELSRQIAYGYDPAARRLSRFLTLLNSHCVEYLLIGGYQVQS